MPRYQRISATRSYHSYDLVADTDFAQCNKVVSFYKVPGWTRKTYGRRYDVVALNCFNVCKCMHYCTYDLVAFILDATLLHWCDDIHVVSIKYRSYKWSERRCILLFISPLEIGPPITCTCRLLRSSVFDISLNASLLNASLPMMHGIFWNALCRTPQCLRVRRMDAFNSHCL